MVTMKISTFSSETPAEEFFKDIPADEVLDLKDMPYDQKIAFAKYCMAFDSLVNASALMNIAFLVYGTKIEDSVFSQPEIWFKNLEEYVDAKYDLKPEIAEYGHELLSYYLSALKSYTVILADGKIAIPASYKSILMTSHIRDISKLMSKYHVNTEDLPLVFDADKIINTFMISDSPAIQGFINKVMERLS